MKKRTKKLLGIATIWPLLYIPLFFSFILAFVFLAGRGGPSNEALPFMFFLIMPLHILTILGGLALSVFYIVNVFRNEKVKKDQQVLWVILLFMFGMIAQPIYWYLYIWPEEPRSKAEERSALNAAGTQTWANYASSDQRPKEYVPPSEPPDWRS